MYSLLKDLVTRKTIVDLANADQTSFMLNLMHGCNIWDFDEETQIDLKRGISYSTALAIADGVF